MENLEITATKYTPEITFDAGSNVLEIKGETYPENTAEFYAPVFTWLDEYIAQLQDQQVTLNLEITYFNSSSSKVLMDLFDRDCQLKYIIFLTLSFYNDIPLLSCS
jgi:hypothetical protein